MNVSLCVALSGSFICCIHIVYAEFVYDMCVCECCYPCVLCVWVGCVDV